MLGWRDLPPIEEMEFEAASFNAWTRKRYLEQGKKHSYFIYDYILVCSFVQHRPDANRAKRHDRSGKSHADCNGKSISTRV
jgi:hypothetical protein